MKIEMTALDRRVNHYSKIPEMTFPWAARTGQSDASPLKELLEAGHGYELDRTNLDDPNLSSGDQLIKLRAADAGEPASFTHAHSKLRRNCISR